MECVQGGYKILLANISVFGHIRCTLFPTVVKPVGLSHALPHGDSDMTGIRHVSGIPELRYRLTACRAEQEIPSIFSLPALTTQTLP